MYEGSSAYDTLSEDVLENLQHVDDLEPVDVMVPTWPHSEAAQDYLKAKKAPIQRNAPVWQRETKWLGAEGVASKELDAIKRRAGVRGMPSTLAILLSDTAWKGSKVEEIIVAIMPWEGIGIHGKGWRAVPIQGPSAAGIGYRLTHPDGTTMTIRPGVFLSADSDNA